VVYRVYANDRVSWVILKALPECSGCMLGCCYAVSRVFSPVSRVFWVVSRVYAVSMIFWVLCQVFWVVPRALLGCFEWLLGCCYEVSIVF